jgi:hypothetical protein
VLQNSSYKPNLDTSIVTDRTTHYYRPDIFILHTAIKEEYLLDVEISSSYKFHKTRVEKLQKTADWKEELLRIRRLNTACIYLKYYSQRVLCQKVHESLKLFNLSPALYILMQTGVMLNT